MKNKDTHGNVRDIEFDVIWRVKDITSFDISNW